MSLASSAARVQGYRDAFSAEGLICEDVWIVPGDSGPESGYHAAKELLEIDDRPTAIFACNDMMAIGAMAALKDAGIHVPQELSVIRYDDIPLASYFNPRLTTIAQPACELGYIAVEMLLERLEDPDRPSRYEMVPVHLIERDSCQRLT